jgi:hypothetical protein
MEEKDGCILCGDSILSFDKDAFDVSFGSEIVARKRAKKETVYYVDLKARKLEKSLTFTFEIK